MFPLSYTLREHRGRPQRRSGSRSVDDVWGTCVCDDVMKFKNPIRIVEEMESVSPTVRGIILAVASGAFFASMHGSVKLLSRDLDAMEIAFFRAFFGFV